MNIIRIHNFMEGSEFKKYTLDILRYAYFNSCVDDNLLSVLLICI